MNKYSKEKWDREIKYYNMQMEHDKVLGRMNYVFQLEKAEMNKRRSLAKIKRVKEICEARNIYKRNSPTFFKFIPNDLINNICKNNILKEMEEFVDRRLEHSLQSGRPWEYKCCLKLYEIGWIRTEEEEIKIENDNDFSYQVRRSQNRVFAGKLVKRKYEAIAKAKKNMQKLLDGITRTRMNKLISKQILDKQTKQDIMSKNYVYNSIITCRQEHQRHNIKFEIEECEKHNKIYFSEHGHKWEYTWEGRPDNINRMKSLCDKLMKAENKKETAYYLMELAKIYNEYIPAGNPWWDPNGNNEEDVDIYCVSFDLFRVINHITKKAKHYRLPDEEDRIFLFEEIKQPYKFCQGEGRIELTYDYWWELIKD